MKKILFLHSSVNFSGGEKVTLMIASSMLAKKNFRPIIGCSKTNTSFIKEARKLNIDVLCIEVINTSKTNFISNMLSTINMVTSLLKHRINLIHVVDPVAYRFTAVASAFVRTPMVFHYHYPYKKEGLEWFFKRLPKPKVMLFCCDAIQRKMEISLRKVAPQSQFVRIHNGIDMNAFTFSINQENDVTDVAILGNLQERKGHIDFLQMASVVKDKGNFRFHIIGDDVQGEHRKKILQEKCQALDISDVVIFHGFVDQVQNLLSKMDILICASYEEAFPLNILEAMAMGIPVVSTDVDGIPEAVKHSTTGYLIKPGDIHGMANFTLQLTKDRVKYEEIANQSFAMVKEQFSTEQFGVKFDKFYQSLFYEK